MNRVVKCVQTVLAAGGLIAMTAEPAAASAVGYAKVVGVCYEFRGQNVCAPVTTLGHYIQGSGKRITRQEASVQDVAGGDTAGGKWCNWRIDWRYVDSNGRAYQVSRGKAHYRCDWLGSIGRVDKTRRTLKHYGKACADFHAGGKKRASQCHYITK
ncbi:hypothetical protein NX801_03025 [Streptomyces sp. LP05-1]|uniref:Secreted protein n=1 Tax=Streptomyces pyxinae TaxID=2970734 RepID=A0ABT2CB61_9ACTN|nr:hypothetical protein [Streptomyces sp. LP05-1]MCS0634646.1 hypothetical protein [Streptomyces sp. LP05-1]